MGQDFVSDIIGFEMPLKRFCNAHGKSPFLQISCSFSEIGLLGLVLNGRPLSH